MLGIQLTSRRLIVLTGIALGAAGIVCLYLSEAVARTASWQQGTLDAFGVGLIIAGIVDVAMISLLNQALMGAAGHRTKEANRLALLALNHYERSEFSTDDEIRDFGELVADVKQTFGDSMDPFLRGRLDDLLSRVIQADEDATEAARRRYLDEMAKADQVRDEDAWPYPS